MLIDLTVSFTASGFSPASKKFAKDFGVSAEVGTLGLSLCVLGFALGPMTLAPLSEYEYPLSSPNNNELKPYLTKLHAGTMDDLLSISLLTASSYSLYSVPPSSRVSVAFSSCDSCPDGSVL